MYATFKRLDRTGKSAAGAKRQRRQKGEQPGHDGLTKLFDAARDRQIQSRLIETLRVNPRNSRTHSNRQIRQIADSIVAHGFLGAIVVDENDTILAGHGRLEAAKLLGLTSVPTLQVDGRNATLARRTQTRRLA